MVKIPKPGTPVRGSKSGSPIMAMFDLLGRRWTMGVLWTLSEQGPSTFRALQSACESISPAVLNSRLKELQTASLVTRGDRGYERIKVVMRIKSNATAVALKQLAMYPPVYEMVS